MTVALLRDHGLKFVRTEYLDAVLVDGVAALRVAISLGVSAVDLA